jgi:hypothetical protein
MLAGLAPLAAKNMNFVQLAQSFPGWPGSFNGEQLRQLPLSEKESLFLKSFPGRIGRFTDARREYIVRWVTHSTRKLHPASDCLRGVGYSIGPLAIESRVDNHQWSVFRASKGDEVLRIYERIYDQEGNSWTDVSSWYWSALLGKSRGPWWTVTIAEIEK